MYTGNIVKKKGGINRPWGEELKVGIQPLKINPVTCYRAVTIRGGRGAGADQHHAANDQQQAANK
jgi:hypothetical protein